MPEPQLDYEQRAAVVSRKQYRRLMALTLLNTVLLAGFVVGPSVGPMVRAQWQQYKLRREARRVQQQQAAATAAAKAYVAPAGQVAYEERPEAAAKLLAVDPTHYRTIRQSQVATYLTPRPWQPPVELKDPPIPSLNSIREMRPAAFIGALSLPSGLKRLVVVYVYGTQHMREDGALVADHRLFRFETYRVLIARIVADSGAQPSPTTLQIGRAGWFSSSATWTRSGEDDWAHGKVDFDTSGLMSIYAGRVDPADPAHFTIDYDCDGQRGTIDGWLRPNDQVEMALRQGTLVTRDTQGRGTLWDLPRFATSRAARVSSAP